MRVRISPREWTMSQEREFMENLVCTRFYYFIVFFSVVIAGAVASKDPIHYKIVLCLGAAVSVPFVGTIARAQQKLDIAIEELKKVHGHPVCELDKQAHGEGRRQLIGYSIPLFCLMVLIAGAVLALCDVLGPAQPAGCGL